MGSTDSQATVLADRLVSYVNALTAPHPDIDALTAGDFVSQFEELIQEYGPNSIERRTTPKLAKEIVEELDWKGFQRLVDGEIPLRAWYEG